MTTIMIKKKPCYQCENVIFNLTHISLYRLGRLGLTRPKPCRRQSSHLYIRRSAGEISRNPSRRPYRCVWTWQAFPSFALKKGSAAEDERFSARVYWLEEVWVQVMPSMWTSTVSVTLSVTLPNITTGYPNKLRIRVRPSVLLKIKHIVEFL